MLMSLLKKLIAKVKSGSSGPLTTDEIMLPVEGSSINPQGGPIGTGISMAHRDQRQMLAGGGIARLLSKKLINTLKKHKKDPEVDDLVTIIEKQQKELDRYQKVINTQESPTEIATRIEKETGEPWTEGPETDLWTNEMWDHYYTERSQSISIGRLETKLRKLEGLDREDFQEGGKIEKQMEEIVVKAKAPPKKEIRKNRRNDFWEKTGSKVWEGAKLVSNPAGYIGGKLLEATIQARKNQDDTSGVGEAETGEPETRQGLQVGGPTEEQMGALMPEEAPIPLETIEEPTETMLPDEEMEEDYVEFIMAEALEPEEQQYLSDKLVEDDQLSIIFDKVIETASEFSGSGSVEGPGSTVSDSIPARLSDGEFVMTAKATDALGADTLEELMALAEQEADAGRQTKAIGGEIENRIDTAPAVTEEDPLKQKQKEWMGLADPRRSLFSS